jgi:uncharacterized glyoxalase superfamily protein PhnB
VNLIGVLLINGLAGIARECRIQFLAVERCAIRKQGKRNNDEGEFRSGHLTSLLGVAFFGSKCHINRQSRERVVSVFILHTRYACLDFAVNCLLRIPAQEVLMSVKPIPDGYHSITPALTVRDAARAIEFYKQAFAAVERGVMHGPDGKVMHAELMIGDSIVMLSDEFPQYGVLSPQSIGGSAVSLHIYLDGVDAAFDRAVKAGAEVEMPVMDQFWGDRYGKLKDPFGHKWSIATHTKDLSMDEMKRGMDDAMAKMNPELQKTA